ncbi:hypothetical protein B4U80_00621 [Leptotrombidium deliense]|uniref:Tropomyosin-like protein n=1 Tax=Leptotrombidium deliense TaxID=299467 RepID=A0A443SLL1_9ACAR|nr:hypothetical protein B4U80_00621 [Leptotrombidium deliense]
MEAIKKKMQAMKAEKDNACERAETAESSAKDANVKAEKSEEEVRALQKKIQQVENELDQVQEQLTAANTKLEEKDKALQNVSFCKCKILHIIDRIADGAEESDIQRTDSLNADDEFLSLRCSSVQTEVISERQRRRTRSSGYPGLAFGSSIFSSGTLMKFSIISNELHNIQNVQLKRKKMRAMKDDLEASKESCDALNIRLQDEGRRREEAEGEVAALNRRIQLIEEDLERSEERLKIATQKLEEASQAADESERVRKALENRTNMEDDRISFLETQLGQARVIAEESDKKYEEVRRLMRKMLEHRSITDEERMDSLESQLKEARMMAEDADRKYDEVARKLAMVEADLERAEQRAEEGESWLVALRCWKETWKEPKNVQRAVRELEEELRVVGNNLKSLEVSEEKAQQREEAYEQQIRVMTAKLKEVSSTLMSLFFVPQAMQKEEEYEMTIRQMTAKLQEAEARAEFAERSVQKLQKEVDRLEEELMHEREKCHLLQEEVETTLKDLQSIRIGAREGEVQINFRRFGQHLLRTHRILSVVCRCLRVILALQYSRPNFRPTPSKVTVIAR